MQTVSPVYTEMMEELIREPSSMRLTFHYPTGNVVYTNADIVKVTESKSAHLIAGELPAIDLSVELINLDGRFNPNSPTSLHDMLMEGVKITYEYGFDIPNLNYYGYFDDGVWHDYGMEEGVPYGFKSSYYTEWLPGGEVFTSGEITYSKTTATIKAKDFLSFLDEKPVVSYGNRTLAQIAKAVIELTDYPENDLGEKKLITGPELDAFSTTIVLSETEDTAVSAKEHLQTIAHAGGVQMYIDRFGYLHLDNAQQGIVTGYHLPLSQQAENPQHNKEQMPKKLTVNLNSEYGSPVEVELKGGGEAMVVDNEFIVTTAEGEALRDRILDYFIKYRNTAEIGYRGEPALDILDTITIDADFGTYVPAIIVGSELTFDGTLSGSLVLRYQLGTDVPKKVLIKGAGNFIYPLGEHDIPSVTSYTLVCETDYPTPSYQWSYYTVSNGQWLNISGETNSTLIVNYNSLYFDNDSSAKFRCIVNNEKGAFTQISKIMLQKDSDSGYRGAVVATTPSDIDVPNVKTGDVVLMDNTSDGTAEIYGEAYIYDGEEWTPTQSSDALAMTYKDALELAENSGKTIYASKIFTDLLVTNKAFIDTATVRRLEILEDDFEAVINKVDGLRFKSKIDGVKTTTFEVLTTGLAYFLGRVKTGLGAADNARVAIKDDSGITSGPTFTGTGLNDLSILEEGAVAGSFRVKISSKDHFLIDRWTQITVGTINWRDITVNSNGRFVAVGESGKIAYSDNGITWTQITVGTNNWYDITVNSSGRFVAVGASGKIAYSDNGSSWTQVTVGNDNWYGIAVNSSGRFIAVGPYGNMARSDNGSSWTQTQWYTNTRNSVTVNSNGRFVAVGNANTMTYSDDGISWTQISTGVSDWYSVTVNSSGRFVAVGTKSKIAYSDNGIAWTEITVGSGDWVDVTVNSSGRFVAVKSSNVIAYSDNGSSWTQVTVGNGSWCGVGCNSSGKFVIVGSSGKVAYTTGIDGIQWSDDNGSTWKTEIVIPKTRQIALTGYDITILFGSDTGHTIGDYWTFTQGEMRALSIKDANGDEYLSAANGILELSGNMNVGNNLTVTGDSTLNGDVTLNGGKINDLRIANIILNDNAGIILRLPNAQAGSAFIGGDLREVSIVSSSYVKVLEWKNTLAVGTVTVQFSLRSSSSNYNAYGRIYKNGSAVGTERVTKSTSYVLYSQNITVAINDYIQIYVKISTGSVYCKDLRVCSLRGRQVFNPTEY